MMLWLASIASAATVAVLDFDGYGVGFSDSLTVTQGVRDAFLEGGKLDPLSGSDIADGVSKGLDEALGRARAKISEGRRLYAAGDAGAAISPLAEGIALHEQAWSDVGRRPELADATFLYALCLLKSGRSTDAKARFLDAVALVPHYQKERGTRMSSDAAALLSAAEESWARGTHRNRSADEVGRIADALDVQYVVTGWVDAGGVVSARLYEGGQLVSETKVNLEERPPLPIDGAYGMAVDRLVDAGLGGGGGAVQVEEPEDEDLDEDPAPLPDLDSDDGDRRPARTTRETSSAPKIKAHGRVRYDQGPITSRWWFWTGLVAVAGGGGVVVWYYAQPAPVEYVVEDDTWSVSVQAE